MKSDSEWKKYNESPTYGEEKMARHYPVAHQNQTNDGR